MLLCSNLCSEVSMVPVSESFIILKCITIVFVFLQQYNMTGAAQNSVIKIHHRNIKCDENHFYAMVLVYLIVTLSDGQILSFKINCQNPMFGLPTCLTTVAKSESAHSHHFKLTGGICLF